MFIYCNFANKYMQCRMTTTVRLNNAKEKPTSCSTKKGSIICLVYKLPESDETTRRIRHLYADLHLLFFLVPVGARRGKDNAK